jgi:hypothetical protein
VRFKFSTSEVDWVDDEDTWFIWTRSPPMGSARDNNGRAWEGNWALKFHYYRKGISHRAFLTFHIGCRPDVNAADVESRRHFTSVMISDVKYMYVTTVVCPTRCEKPLLFLKKKYYSHFSFFYRLNFIHKTKNN